MDSGIINLKPLYDFVRLHKDDMTALNGNSRKGREYGRECLKCVDSVGKRQGFYLWGFFESNGLWRNVYLGKAGLGKSASLRSRILEELKDERWFVWRNFWDELYLRELGGSIYPRKWNEYAMHVDRAFRKARSTHIVWVLTPNLTNKDVLRVEADLIEAMNPGANHQRPTPPSSLQQDTAKVFEILRQRVHDARPSASKGQPLQDIEER